MKTLVVLCRSGYESVVCDELNNRLSAVNAAGYGQFNKGDAWLQFHIVSSANDLQTCLTQLVFARQIWWQRSEIRFTDKHDRIKDITAVLTSDANQKMLYDDVIVEYADTEKGKEMAKFARKFTVPLRQELRTKSLLTKSGKCVSATTKTLHLLMLDFDTCILGESIAKVSANEAGGITRLKFPPAAPSRSTLKLEDAILHLLSYEEQQRIFYSGASAVDLGACPGGWTYQLVKRGMHVEAVDNGAIDDTLMATGLVQHFAADGFTYKPAHGRVTLLVCDMIEKPDRVAKLMVKWLVNEWADHAIFNLKLPMKQRFTSVNQCLTLIREQISNKSKRQYRIVSKHLYHDRDEVTVCIVCDSLD